MKVLSWLIVSLQMVLLVITIAISCNLFAIVWVCLNLILCIAMAVFVSTY